jgi:hypothetical protein
LKDLGILDETTKRLLENGIKIQKGQSYKLGKYQPVEDGVDRFVKSLESVTDDVDHIVVDL